MKKSLSPVFVIVVLVIALALGALYFMVRYRANEAQWAAESQALQRGAARGIESGDRMRTMRARDGDARSGATRLGGARSAPEAESEPETP